MNRKRSRSQTRLVTAARCEVRHLFGLCRALPTLAVIILLLVTVQSSVCADHVGPLVLTGNRTYVIENTTYVLSGPVELRDNAVLVIRNSTVELSQDYHEENNWWFSDSSRLIIENSEVISPFTHTLTFTGNSRGEIDHGTLMDAFLTLGEAATVTIRDSSIQHVSLDLVNVGTSDGDICVLEISSSFIHEISFGLTGDAAGTIRGLHPGIIPDWRLTGIRNAGMKVHLANIEIENINWLVGGTSALIFSDCVFWQLSVIDNGQVIIENSEVGQAGIVFEAGQHAVLRNLISGKFVTFWGLHETDPQTNVPFDYIVRNSIVHGWYLRSRGADLTLEDCDLHNSRLRPEFDSVSSRTRVIRSYVEELMLWWSHGHVEFEDSTVHHIVTPVESTTTISGTVTINEQSLKSNWGPWMSSHITREFPVLVQDEGSPLAGVPFTLRNASGGTVRNGWTAADGTGSFTIYFDDYNYTQTWQLLVGESVTVIPVAFLSDSPLSNVPASRDNSERDGARDTPGAVVAQKSETEAGFFTWAGSLVAGEPKEITVTIADASYVRTSDRVTRSVRLVAQHLESSGWGTAIQALQLTKRSNTYGYFEDAWLPVALEDGKWIGTFTLVPCESLKWLMVCKTSGPYPMFGVSIIVALK